MKNKDLIKKSNPIKDYLKCVIANKPTLSGFISAGIASTLFYIQKETSMDLTYYGGNFVFIVSGIGGGLLLGCTLFGCDTYVAYKRTKNHIKNHGTINKRFNGKFKDYCSKIGIKLAAKEAGLEDLLK